MEKSDNSFPCDICKKRSISKQASRLCPHCEDGLCSECLEHHRASKSTYHHHVIPIDEYKVLPKCVATVKHRCDAHKDEFEFYCPNHAVACCVDCTKSTHGTCPNLTPLHDVVGNVKTSHEFHEIERNISEIAQNIARLTKERQDNISHLEKQKSEHVNTIKRMRKTINDHLDKVEKSIMDDLTATHDSTKHEIENLIAKLDERKRQAKAIQDEIDITKQAASPLQTFIGMRDISRRIGIEGKTLIKLQEDENFYQSEINISYSHILATFSERIQYFGQVLLKAGPKSINLYLGDRRRSQIILPKSRGIEHIKMRNHPQRIKLGGKPDVNISGCEILNTGKLLFVDWKQECLLSCNYDGTQTQTLTNLSKSGPFDITKISEDQVAVTLKKEKSIAVIEIASGNVLRKMNVNGDCTGIDHNDGNLFVRLTTDGVFLSMDLNGKVLSRIRYAGEKLRYFVVFMERIYCSVTGENSIVCMNKNGALLWTFRNVLLREPFGIGVDPNGYVYVAIGGSNNVMLISPDGKDHRTILHSDRDGICRPQALSVSMLRRQLLVCNKNDGFAYLYDF